MNTVIVPASIAIALADSIPTSTPVCAPFLLDLPAAIATTVAELVDVVIESVVVATPFLRNRG